METILFKYNGNPITFRKDGEIWINATEMARPFGKRVNDWKNLPSTKSLLISFKNTRFSGIIETKRGRNVGGTWIHRKLAIAFAMWLSDDFHLWVLDHIDQLMDKGVTTLDSISKKDLALMLYESEIEKEKLQALNEENGKMIVALIPKAQLADQLLASDEMFSMEQVAKMLFDRYKIGRNRLFKALREKGVLTKANLPTMEYMNKGYFYVRQTHFGKKVNTMLFVYNEGIRKIMELLNIEGYQQQLMLIT